MFTSSNSFLSALFSRSSTPGTDALRAAVQPSKPPLPKSPLPPMEDDLSTLEPFPNLRLPSVMEEVSELFMSASLGSDSAQGACRLKFRRMFLTLSA